MEESPPSSQPQPGQPESGQPAPGQPQPGRQPQGRQPAQRPPDEAAQGEWGADVWRRTVRAGLVAGLLGAAVVALWFLVMDVIFREPLYTPAALGSLLFRGAVGAEEVEISAGIVVGYTIVHVLAFLTLGVLISTLLTGLERYPSLFGAAVILFAVSAVVFLGVVTFLGVWILEDMAVWAVLVGNLLAAVLMAWYLARSHPRLREELKSDSIWREI